MGALAATTPPAANIDTPPGYEQRSDWVLAAVAALLGLLGVSALLAWTAGLGSFATWYRFVTVPSVLLLGVLAVWVRHRGPVRLRNALVAGVIGGLAGTAAYDIVRQPFLALGMRLLAPIDSYGVLALDAVNSSATTGIAGWGFHVTNGVGFGVVYAVIARGRNWGWGVLWGLVLEAAAIVTPFSAAYGLRWKWDLILIAFAAHIPYGVAVGLAAQHADRLAAFCDRRWWTRAPTALAVTFAAIVLWQMPWRVPEPERAARAFDPAPGWVIVDRAFNPTWARVPSGGCVTVRNDDDAERPVPAADGSPTLGPGETRRLCFTDTTGTHRVRVGDGAYTGGWVIVDPHAPG